MTAAIQWLRRLSAGRERAEKEALAERLRRELVVYEARLSDAVERLEAATTEESNAGLALCGRELNAGADPQALEAARKRLAYAKKGRELAGIGFGLARSRVNLHAGVLHQLEQELAESE